MAFAYRAYGFRLQTRLLSNGSRKRRAGPEAESPAEEGEAPGDAPQRFLRSFRRMFCIWTLELLSAHAHAA